MYTVQVYYSLNMRINVVLVKITYCNGMTLRAL